MNLQAHGPSLMASRQGYGAVFVRFLLAPLLGLFSGFHTMDFIVGGIYTWPQMSRVLALTFAVVILCYEFVYKENRDEVSSQRGTLSRLGLKAVLYSCLLPYAVGMLALLSLVISSQ